VPLSRRSLLLAGAIGLTSACHLRDRPPAVDPDLGARGAALQTEQLLLAAYIAVIAAQPRQEPHLRGLLADHAAHVARLTTGTQPTPQAGTARTVPELLTLERAAAASHGAAAVTATRAFAPMLASLAAASACAAASL
jgi:hypothetical protein